jgi:hypothetical protein
LSNSPATNSSSTTSAETSAAGSSVALVERSPSASTLSWTSELNLDVDRGRLSPKNRAVFDLIWTPISQGQKPSEIATRLQRAPSWVSDRLNEFYTEALFQQGIFPPLPADEYEALRESIAAQGVQVAIVVDERGDVIDGHQRRHIARELGIDCPAEVREGLTLAERRELAITLNGPRRHMSRVQKRQLIVAELMVERDRSDRAIGRLAGVDHKTVGRVRAQLEEEEKTYAKAQAQVEAGELPQRNDSAVTERLLGKVACPHCQAELELWRRAGEYMLDQVFSAAAA